MRRHTDAQHRAGRLLGRLLCWAGGLLALAGCGTTRFTDTSRTATEMMLISTAVDQSVSQMNFQMLSGKKVFLDPQYLPAGPDHGYLVSTLRQHLLSHGCLLMEDRKEATYVVEARCGAIGTDRHDLLFGIPQMQLPTVPGMVTPSVIPEIPFAKKTEQKGVAKLAVFAYNRQTGRPVFQSGEVKKSSSSRDMWVLGAGPFRQGNITQATEFAGTSLHIPFFVESPDAKEQTPSGIPVTQTVIWEEPNTPSPLKLLTAGVPIPPLNPQSPPPTATLGRPQ